MSDAAGQSAYGYANTVAEMMIMSRRAAGLPGLAIEWGPVAHVGYVAETLKVCNPWSHLPCVFLLCMRNKNCTPWLLMLYKHAV